MGAKSRESTLTGARVRFVFVLVRRPPLKGLSVSIEAISKVLGAPVGGIDKLVLIGLANHAHPDLTQAFPSQKTLARYAHCSDRAVRYALDRLERAGFIERAGTQRLKGLAGRAVIVWNIKPEKLSALDNPSSLAKPEIARRFKNPKFSRKNKPKPEIHDNQTGTPVPINRTEPKIPTKRDDNCPSNAPPMADYYSGEPA